MGLEEAEGTSRMVEPTSWLCTFPTKTRNDLDQINRITLHLWLKDTFKEIGDKCRGCHITEEESELRNHLKWARIEVRSEGRRIPNEVAIAKKGYTFRVPIWVEKATTFKKASVKIMAE